MFFGAYESVLHLVEVLLQVGIRFYQNVPYFTALAGTNNARSFELVHEPARPVVS